MKLFRFHKFIADLRSISLSTQEKSDLRNAFLAQTGIQAQPVSIFNTQAFRYAKLAAYSFLIFAIGITPLALAAEKSQPGDFLYPVKIAVNEPVKKSIRVVNPFDRADEVRNDRSVEQQQIVEEKKEEIKVKLENKPTNARVDIAIPKPLPVQVPVPKVVPNLPTDVIPPSVSPDILAPAADIIKSTTDKAVDDVVEVKPPTSASKTIKDVTEKILAPVQNPIPVKVQQSTESVIPSINLSL